MAEVYRVKSLLELSEIQVGADLLRTPGAVVDFSMSVVDAATGVGKYAIGGKVWEIANDVVSAAQSAYKYSGGRVREVTGYVSCEKSGGCRSNINLIRY